MNDLDQLLTAVDPLRAAAPTALGPGVAHTLAELTMTTAPSTPVPSRRSRRRLGVIAGLSVAVIAVPGTALALRGGIHTGIFAGSGETESHPGEEILNLSDPAIVPLVKEEIARTPIPPGTNLDKVLALYPMKDSVGQRRVIVNNVEGSAQCLWYVDWLHGDAATRARDITVIDQIPHWAFTENFADDGGRQLLARETAEMDRGVETLVRQDIAANCS